MKNCFAYMHFDLKPNLHQLCLALAKHTSAKKIFKLKATFWYFSSNEIDNLDVSVFWASYWIGCHRFVSIIFFHISIAYDLWIICLKFWNYQWSLFNEVKCPTGVIQQIFANTSYAHIKCEYCSIIRIDHNQSSNFCSVQGSFLIA